MTKRKVAMMGMLTNAGACAYPFGHEGEKMAETDILEIEKQYPDEWLLFEVYEIDKQGRPIKGRLLAHSPSRAALDEYWDKIPHCHHSYVTYTGERPKRGMAVVL